MQVKVAGFALSEAMLALGLVAIAALMVVRSSGANALVRTRSVAKATAVALAVELAEWTRRRGEALLGTSLADALAAGQPERRCDEGSCDAGDGARHYIAEWKSRLQHAIPDARVAVCADHLPATDLSGWACGGAGPARFLKIGWPPYPGATAMRPAVVVELGPVS